MIKNNLNGKLLVALYIIFIISNIYLGSIKVIGNFSIRVPLAIISFSIILLSTKTKHGHFYLFFPIFFLVGYLLSVLINDISWYGEFLRVILASFFITYIMVFFSFIVIPRYLSLNKMLLYIGILLTINSMVIIGQFFDIPFFWSIGNYFYDDRSSNSDIYSLFSRHGTIYGVVGVVESGYFLVTAVLIYLYNLNRNYKSKYYSFILLLINIIAALLIQQRTALVLIIFSIVLYFLLRFNNMKMTILFLLLSGVSYFLFDYFTDYLLNTFSAETRVTNFEDYGRVKIYANSLIFIRDHIFFGDFNEFHKFNNGVSPHNIFFNAWIRGGFLGFCSISAMIILIFKKIFKIIFSNFLLDKSIWIISLILLNEIFLSFTHNPGLASGHQITYLILSLFIIELNQQSMFVKRVR